MLPKVSVFKQYYLRKQELDYCAPDTTKEPIGAYGAYRFFDTAT